MRVLTCVTTMLAASLVVTASIRVHPWAADGNPFLGRWNLSGTGDASDRIYWLEVKEDGGKLSGMFLNRGGSPARLPTIRIENGELIFQPAGRPDRPAPAFRARVEGDRLVGTTTGGDRPVQWIGVRPPKWPAANANGRHEFAAPIELFDGKSLDGWEGQRKGQPLGWSVVDGVMTNEEKANNLVSKERFKDFRIRAEYKLAPTSNSGIYLRGRYELQVLDDHGKPPEEHGHMAIYAWTRPAVNASLPPDEWQTMEATIVANRVTVTLNGKTVHDNAEIQAITGGALDARETDPGPIMLQGDHGKVWFRKVTVTPIRNVGT
jgi:hypothetical protein